MSAWRSLVGVLFAAAALLAAARTSAAGIFDGSAKTFDAFIPGHPELAWKTVLKTFLVEAHVNDKGAIEASSAPQLRLLKSDEDTLPDTLLVTSLTARDVVEKGHPRLLVLAEFDPSGGETLGVALLALIDTTGEPKLLDLLSVAEDRETYLEPGAPLKIGRDSDLILISNAHLDAGADYQIRTAYFVDGDRLHVLDRVFLLSVTPCGFRRTQQIHYAVQPAPGVAFDSLQVTATEKTERIAEDCDPSKGFKAGVRTWRASYRWNPLKREFVAHSKALDDLAKHNSEGL